MERINYNKPNLITKKKLFGTPELQIPTTTTQINTRLTNNSDSIIALRKNYQKNDHGKSTLNVRDKPAKSGCTFKDLTDQAPKKCDQLNKFAPKVVVCDINKNLNGISCVKNGDVSRARRASSSCSSRSSTRNSKMSDAEGGESMIMMRKTYKENSLTEFERDSKTVEQGIIKRTYKKIILGSDDDKNEIPQKKRLDEKTTENKEEFYKYLGIDTKPPEKRVCRPEFTNLDIFKRRSLRVRYLKIQNQSPVQGKCEMNTENKIKTSPEPCDDDKMKKEPEVRQHDVKILRSYLKPKIKKTENYNSNIVQKEILAKKRSESPTVVSKPVKKVIKSEKIARESDSVKYLMRSRINLSETRLRSGLQKKRLLQPSRYLSYFKNKSVLLNARPRKDLKQVMKVKETKKKPPKLLQPVKPVIKSETTVELPKSPVPQVPDSTVNFQTPPLVKAEPAHVSTTVSCTNSNHTLKNPLNNNDGQVLYAYVMEEKLVIIQERIVSFWKYSPFKHLVGLDQTWELIGRTKRHEFDIEIDSCKSDRICFNEKNPIYIELRATQANGNENRQCPLSSVYVVVYSINSKQEFPGWTSGPVIKNFVQLDSVQSSANDIHFIALPGTRYFIISWYQHLIQSKSSGLCKYSLTPDLRTLASIREFPHANHNIYDLKNFEDYKLLGLGNTELSIWNHNTGDLIMSIDFNLPLGRNISIFEFKNEVIQCMFLTQIIDSITTNHKSIKVLGINLNDDSWKILKTHELPLNFNKSSKISTADTKNVALCSIDNGQSLVMMSKNDLQWIKLVQNPTNLNRSDVDLTANVQLFFNGSQVVEIGENILIKSMDEFCLQI
uniref:CSON006251 protein n=1 Tax=Culicoides sonorensis TaxID=179676 RepID=A0A336MW07_CULSO